MSEAQLGSVAIRSAARGTAIPALISLIGAAMALFPGNPANMSLPSRDSGVFLYVAWRWLSGDIPYRDVWDHKPPLIYVVDALGLSLTPDSLWGVWLLQFAFIFLTLFFIYKVLDGEFGTFAALAGSLAFTSGLLTVLEQGNVTEQYALVFQALCLRLFLRAYRKDFPPRAWFWIGLCGGLAFNFKQTTIGLWIACALLIFAIRILQRRSPLLDLLALLVGGLVPSLVLVVYLASQNALMDFWEQAFLYNFIYIGKHEGIRRLLPVFFKGFALLSQGGLLYLTVLGWLAGLGYLWVNRKASPHPLIVLALVDLPIEVILITVSGRSIIHYYLTLLPVMGILTGVLIYTVPRLLEKISSHSSLRVSRWAPTVLLAAVVLLQLGQVKSYPEYVQVLGVNEYTALVDYISKNTQEDDKVLIIGAESVVNFLARREAPTRYVYQYPLALLGRRPMFEEYFNQILENRPVLIIDTRGRTRLDEKLYVPLQKRSEIVREGVQYLGENYQQVAQFGEWFVYRLIEDH